MTYLYVSFMFTEELIELFMCVIDDQCLQNDNNANER